ncbi:MAG: hypothetical protein A3G23_01825 [Bacteroidetes bacterium RIFCSPLOWO2_12_FULL_37_12]|nr:MAG: hypothetical protein A3G23_01825 [Bacteroidetes bacterium RIFCSPLOWO2_12_FULL_37_12]
MMASIKFTLYAFVCIYFFSSGFSNAQNFVVEGNVLDEANQSGIPNATIISDDSTGTLTDINGFYRLTFENNLPKIITFQSMGFQIESKKVIWKDKTLITLNIQLKEMIFPLEQIVVSSSRFKQELNEVSVSMELLKPTEIGSSNSITLDKALEKVPGVNVVDGQINIRGGSGYSYGAGSRVMLLVDDLPMLSADANDVKWKFIPVEMTEQVEIIKGASSALYGSSALGGVVNLRTKYARNTPETMLKYFRGFYGKPRNKDFIWSDRYTSFTGYSIFHSQKIKRLDISLCASTFDDEGYRQGEYNSYIRLNANLKYNTKINGLSYGVNLAKMNDNGALFFYWLSDKKPFVPAPNTISKYNNYRGSIDPFIFYAGNRGNKHSLRTRIYNTININSKNQESDATGYYAEYLYQKLFEFNQKSNLNISTGTLVSKTFIYSDSLYGNHNGLNEGVFLQLDPKINFLNISLGARYESYQVDTFTRIYSPVFRSGMSINPWKGGYIRVSAGQGFRYPSVAELFTETQAGSIRIYPNPLLKPEKGYSTEAGIRQGFNFKHLQGFVDFSVFLTEYKNLMEYAYALYNAPPGTWPTPQNHIKYGGFQSKNVTNRARIKGIETNLFIEKKSGVFKWQLVAGHTWIDPIDMDYVAERDDTLGDGFDNMLKYRYRNLSKVNLSMQFKKVELGSEFRYNSFMQNIDPVFNLNQVVQGVYAYRKNHNYGDYIIDVHLAYYLKEKSKINFIYKNLLNREYMYIPGNMGAPVSIVVQVEYNF